MDPAATSHGLRTAIDATLAAGDRAFNAIYRGPERLGARLEHPVPAGHNPVVLETGFTNDPQSIEVWRRSLADDGFDVHVHADPEHGLGDIEQEATRLGSFVDDVLASHPGATKVDVVGYSSGNTAVRAWMSLQGGAGKVQRFVDLDGSWNGDDDSTLLRRIGSVPVVGDSLLENLPVAEFQLQRSSDLFARLAQHPEIPPGVQVTTISSPHTAATNAAVGAANLVVPTKTSHAAMARRSVAAYELGRTALLAPAIAAPPA